MNQLKKEMGRFIVAGITAVTTDLGSYVLLLGYLDPSIAKTISFIIGTTIAFAINKFWTFSKYQHSYAEITKFTLLYTGTLTANVMTNAFVLINLNSLSQDLFFSASELRGFTLKPTDIIFLAFLTATAVSTILNFIGQKWWVFK